jgi:hypothetical protein
MIWLGRNGYAIWGIAIARYTYSISQLKFFYDHETQTNKQARAKLKSNAMQCNNGYLD